MYRGLILVLLALLMSGCAALAPVSALIGSPHGSAPPLQVHEETKVDLARGNFALLKTNVWGQSKGFSLLGFITIYPPTLVKAMNRMYAAARMQPGQPQTVAHLIIEQTSSYYILFGIPKIEVRADIVEFNPELKNKRSAKLSPGTAAQSPDHTR